MQKQTRLTEDLYFMSVIFCYRKLHEGLTMSEISRTLRRHHGTVSNQLKAYERLIKENDRFKYIEKTYIEDVFLNAYSKILKEQGLKSVTAKLTDKMNIVTVQGAAGKIIMRLSPNKTEELLRTVNDKSRVFVNIDQQGKIVIPHGYLQTAIVMID